MNNLKNLITRTSAYNKVRIPFTNTYLIQWLPSSRTDIHNHLGEKCDFVPLYGSLHEVRFHQKNIGSLYESKKRNVFEKVHINDDMGYHQIFNFDKNYKLSIHRYY
tara:strand:+ start:1761 stop:2078 length:318 start_codon:yes stop_codon:yes gene_type:complete